MDDETFDRLLDIFAKAQSVWEKMEAVQVRSDEWNRLRAEHTAYCTLYNDARSGVLPAIN